MQTVLITGANRGIGLELVRQYAAAGWRVLACCRTPAQAVALNELAYRHPATLEVHALDVSDFARIEQLARQLADEAIDVLLNNAGVYPQADRRGFGHTDYEEWSRALRINTMAPLRMAECFVDQVARSERRIIATVSSMMGSVADNSSGGSYLYRSSKAAVNMVNRSLAHDLKERGITAVVLNPGWVKTDMGGPNAMIEVEESVAGLRRVLADIRLADSGRFLNYDGQEIPW